MRARLTLGWLLVLGLMAAIGSAQETPARTLSLAEAVEIALRNNPEYLMARNDRGPAAWQVRTTTLSLLTPSVGISGNYSTTASGTRQDFFGIPRDFAAVTTQSYSFGLGYQFSGQTLAARGQAGANLRAAEEEIAGARTLLETAVRTSYLNSLQANAQQELARRSLERATEILALAQARYSVGQGTLIEVRRAEVGRGQTEVGLLRADQNVQTGQLRLFQQLGTPKPEGTVLLTDSFPVERPSWSAEQLIAMAVEENPTLRSLRAREHAATWSVRATKSQFLPSLSASAGFSASRTETEISVVDEGSGDTVTIPVSTSNRNPWGLSISASLPLYDRFARNTQIAQAQAQEDDLRQRVRAWELQLRTEVTAALNAVQAAWQTIDIQRRNQDASNEALELATQRYRVGSGTYIELLDAQVAAEQAAADYVGAIYEYHRAIAALENAVGRRLR